MKKEEAGGVQHRTLDVLINSTNWRCEGQIAPMSSDYSTLHLSQWFPTSQFIFVAECWSIWRHRKQFRWVTKVWRICGRVRRTDGKLALDCVIEHPLRLAIGKGIPPCALGTSLNQCDLAKAYAQLWRRPSSPICHKAQHFSRRRQPRWNQRPGETLATIWRHSQHIFAALCIFAHTLKTTTVLGR